MDLSQWTLSRKLVAAFGAVSIIVMVQAVFVWANIRFINDQLLFTSAKLIPQAQRIADLEMNIIRASLETRHAMLMRTPEKRDEAIAVILKHKEAADAIGKEIEANLSTDEGRRRFQNMVVAKEGFWAAAGQILPAVQAGDTDKSLEMLVTVVIPARNAFLDKIRAQREWQESYVSKSSSEALNQSRLTQVLALLVAAVVATLGMAMAVFLARHISRQLGGEPQQAMAAVNAIAQGDLVTPVPLRPGDHGSVMAALADMRASLTQLVRQVQQGVESVNTAATEIASGNADLSQRTEQQASNLQQTASSMTEMTSSVKANADNARQANQMATSASEAAQTGGQVVGRVVDTMGDIRASSQKIADIIGTIDGIAFQTNILALNAAVEAARAGEAGRGFAVVASEVRSLASRSADAAREIKSLINESVDKVSNGHELVVEAGRSMDEIVQQVRRVTDLIGEISSASEQQSRGIAEVGSAVAQIDQGTQQNAALVEESAAAAESLKQQATQLIQAVGVFRTSSGGSATLMQPSVSPAPRASRQTAVRSNPVKAPAKAASFSSPAKPVAASARPVSAAPAAPAPAATAAASDDDWTTF
jgi:methyl-accepting chemotaxis protein